MAVKHLVLLTILSVAGPATGQSLVPIADSGTLALQPGAELSPPAIADDGSVAFIAPLADGRTALLVGSGGETELADYALALSTGDVVGGLVIESIVGGGFQDGPGVGGAHFAVRVNTDGGSQLIVSVTDPEGDGSFEATVRADGVGAVSVVPINALGQVAVNDSSNCPIANGIRVSDGTTEFSFCGNDAPLGHIQNGHGNDINEAGQVTFYGRQPDNVSEQRINDPTLFRRNSNGSWTTIAIGDQGGKFGAHSHDLPRGDYPALNASGTAIFTAKPNQGGLISAVRELHTGSGGPWTLVASNESGAFRGFGRPLALNDVGTPGFLACTDPSVILGNCPFRHVDTASGGGIYRGPDPVADKVIGIGDAVSGSTVTRLRFTRAGLNNNDEFAFVADLADGRQVITRTREAGLIRWVSEAGGSWDDASNWDPEQVPGPDDTAVFDLAASYDVSFSAAAALARVSRGAGESCASTRPVEATRVRDGVVTYTGEVDVSTLSDAPDNPGLRVGGQPGGADPTLILEGGELCSIFSTVGDTSVVGSTATVQIQAGEWRNEGRLRVGDQSEGHVVITGGSVVAAETRVGRRAGGEIRVEGASADLDTGALLVGSPELILDASVEIVLGSARSDATLIGAALAVCVDGSGDATETPCASNFDCLGIEGSVGCNPIQSLTVDAGVWSAMDPVKIGGGVISLDDDGAFENVAGSGSLFVGPGGQASMPELSLGNNDIPGRDLTPAAVSRGTARVEGLLEVFGPLRVGGGGAGQLDIEPGGRVEVTGATTVGRPSHIRPLQVRDPFHPGFFKYGVVRISGLVNLGASGEALLRTQSLFVRSRGRVALDEGTIRATEQVRIELNGQLTGTGTVITPDFDVAASGRLGPVFPLVVNRARTPRGTESPAGLTIEGDLTLAPGAVVEIAAVGPGACGKLHVTGDATLGGTLEMVFPDGYLPGAGELCEVLTVGGATSGAFERVVARGVAEGFVYEATTTPDGSIRFGALSEATACAGGDTDGDGIADCERCNNCVDDTGNGLVDRDDSDCTAPADGDGAGLASAVDAQAVVRCHAALRGATKLLATKTWKPLQKCADAMLKCRQRKPDDARCTEKVAAKCAKAAAKLTGEKGPAAKAEAKILQACSAVPIDALKDAAGLGHAAAEGACAAVGVPGLATAADISACTTRRQQCQVGELFGAVVPRAAELLGDGGMAGTVPCLAQGSDGGGLGLGDPKGAGKRAASCQKALGKAAGKLLGRALDAGGRCEGAVLACVQSGDGSCLARAEVSCAREQSKLASAENALLAAIEKKCGQKKGSPLVSAEDLLAPAGLGFEGATERCEALGVPLLDSRAAVGACLVAENSCRAGKLGEAATPRNLELLTLGGVN